MIIFNGTNFRTKWGSRQFRVLEIVRPVLNKTVKSSSEHKKIGADITSVKRDPNEIVATIRYIGTLAQRRQFFRELAAVLDTDTEVDLSFTDEPNLKYKAIVTGEVVPDESGKAYADAEITWFCSNPNAIGSARSVSLTASTTVTPVGTAEIFPRISVTISNAEAKRVVISNTLTGRTVTLRAPSTFAAGAVLNVDCKTHKVSLGSATNMTLLTIDSRFLYLVSGKPNPITIKVYNAAGTELTAAFSTATLQYEEEWK